MLSSTNHTSFTSSFSASLLSTCINGHVECCDRKSRATCVQTFAPGQQATIEIMCCNLSCYCLLALHIMVLFFMHIPFVVNHTINANGEVATPSPPFYNEPHQLHVLCVKAELGTTPTSWSQHHFVAIGNPKRHMCKALHCGRQATIEIMCRNLSYYCLLVLHI